MQNTLSVILQSKAVAIIRVKESTDIPSIADCLVESGITALEITSNTPNYLNALIDLQQQYPDLRIGAGTITTPQLAHEAIEAGAHFLVTPNTSKTVIDEAKKASIPILAGAFTPTEIYQAYEWGADLIKVFPTNNISYNYITSLVSGPFNQIPLLAVGSVDETNARKWLEAGCVGVGFGGELTQPIEDAAAYTARKTRIKYLLDSIM